MTKKMKKQTSTGSASADRRRNAVNAPPSEATTIQTYIIFTIKDEKIRVDGRTTTYSGDPDGSRTVHDYGFSRSFDDALDVGKIDELVTALAGLALSDAAKETLERTIASVKQIPFLKGVLDLKVRITDIAYRKNCPEDPKNQIAIGIGFAPENITLGSVTISGFGFRYTHNLDDKT